MKLKTICTFFLLTTSTLLASPRKCEYKAGKCPQAKTTAAPAQATTESNAALADDTAFLPLHRFAGSIL